VGPQWVHEIKHDGYRLIVRQSGGRARLYTRRGFDWTDRFPRIVEALARLKVFSITLDGEAVVCREDGASDFDKLHSNGYDDLVVLYAFDLLELNGEDWRSRPLEERKAKLANILARVQDGICYNEHLSCEGVRMFEHVCRMGLEGVISKRRDFPYRSGRTKSWIKVKKPASPAMLRVKDGTW
jgi:ATP-dependent DNA ligase